MGHLDLEAGFLQIVSDRVGDHNGTVMPPRAPERDRQIALALANVVRQQINQKLGDVIDEFYGLWKAPDVSRYRRVSAGQVFEPGYVVRVRQEADVKNQVAVGGQPVAVAEAVT